MKLIVAGSRDFHNYELAVKEIRDFINTHITADEDITIFSGGANGADQLGERFAKEHNYEIKQFQAQWNDFGKAAGPIRNKEMAHHATHCLVFWNQVSKGSRNMILEAKKKGLPTKVVLI